MERKSLDLHFVWEEWSAKERKKYYLKIQEASDEEKEIIAKELTLLNAFLLKRVHNIAFHNYIYSQIEKDEELLFSIKRVFLKILSRVAMKEKHIQEAINKNSIKLKPIISRDLEKISNILDENEQSTLLFFEKKIEESLKNNKLEDAIIYESFLKEYETKISHIEDLFIPSFPYKGIIPPQKYKYLSYSFLITNLRNYQIYKKLSLFYKLNFLSEINELSELFSKSFTKKILNIIFEYHDIEKNIENFLNYNILINDLLSIASRIYFCRLKFNDKIKLLNKQISLYDLAENIQMNSIEFDYFQCKNVLTALQFSGYLKIAIFLAQKYFKTHFKDLNDEFKYNFLDTLATLYKFNENYQQSLKYYKEAYKWIDKITPYKNLIDPFNLNEILDLKEDALKCSMKTRKAIALKNIAEAYGHIENKTQMEKYFNKVNELIKKVNNEEKNLIYWNLSFAYRRLNNFEKERYYLNQIIDTNTSFLENTKIENYLNQRLNEFLETEMNKDKLIKIEYEKNYNEHLYHATIAQNSFNFKESIEFYKQAFKISEKLKNIDYKISTLKGIAFSYLYLQQWEKSKENFETILSFTEDYESKSILSLIYYILNENDKAFNVFNEICTIYCRNPERYSFLFQNWILNCFNCLGFEQTKDILLNLSENKNYQFLLDLGIFLADMGFSKFSIKILRKAYDKTSDNSFKACCIANIGTVYSNLDKHLKAIKCYNEAIELQNDDPSFFHNRASSYAYMLNFLAALRDINMALNLAIMKELPDVYIYELKKLKKDYEYYSEFIVNIHLIKNKDAVNAILTSEKLYFDYKGKEPIPDASPIIKEYAKCLEIILDDKFHDKMKSLTKKRFKNNMGQNKNLSFLNLLFKDEKYTISLGTWVKFFKSFEQKNLHPDTLFFKENIQKLLKPYELKLIIQACDYLSSLRNPTSHYKNISYEEISHLRKKIISLLNKVIDILYNLES
ncbi:MAG: tetratricopeptide repeat protein [Promethearchaeia archaeon]